MLIDFLKLNISYLSEKDLLENSLIEWQQNIDLNTGEMIHPIKGKYKNMDLKINAQSKILSGSIHVLKNLLIRNGKHNYNDFYFIDILEMIEHLKNVFSLDLKKTIIQNLEVGLNIETNERPETILNENLIAWNHKRPAKDNEYKGNGKGIEFETSQYYIKLYDKGKQFKTGKNILRIEVKIMRNEFLEKKGIVSLQDLTDKAKIRALFAFLIETYNHTILIDKNPLKPIKKARDKEVIKKGINPRYWTIFQCRKKRLRFKKNFNSIIEKYGLNQTFKEIENKLILKGKELLKCPEMNEFKDDQKEIKNQKKCPEMKTIYTFIS